MYGLQRISRLREPRSNRVSTALLVITFSVFALLTHFAMDQQRGATGMARESAPARHDGEQLDLHTLLLQLRF